MFSVITTSSQTKDSQNPIRINISGKIIDKHSNEPIDAVVSLYDINNNRIGHLNTKNNGNYLFKGLMAGKPYTIIIESNNYAKEECYVIIPFVKKSITFKKDFLVKSSGGI